MTDWFDAARDDEITIMMVDPNNLGKNYGVLTGAILKSTSLSYGYDVETRTSGSISLLDGTNYVKNSWLRFHHTVKSDDYHNELGTYILTNPVESYTGEGYVRTYDMYSVLWGIKEDLYPGNFQIAAKTSSDDAFKMLCNSCKRDYVITGTNKYTYENAAIFEVGESYLNMLYSVASASNNRIDVDGHGNITLSRYVQPNKITPSWTLDVDDPRSIIIEGSISMDSSIEDTPSRIIVTDTSGNNVILAYSDVPNNSEFSASKRGYIKAELMSDLKPSSYAMAKAYSDAYAKATVKTVEWKMSTLYFPCKPGQTCVFIKNKEKHNCLIDTVDSLNLETMTMDITLKELTEDV